MTLEVKKMAILLLQYYRIQGQALLALEEWDATRRSFQSGLSLLHKTGARWGFLELTKSMSELEK
ncbi:MAG: hypothetical protein ACOC9C_02670 [Chloroflexota bacterium]